MEWNNLLRSPGHYALPSFVELGPAGFYAAEMLLKQRDLDVSIDIFNRSLLLSDWFAAVLRPIISPSKR